MTTTYKCTSYCASNPPVLRCASRDNPVTRPRHSGTTADAPDVDLIPCNRPQGPLESAPRTSLCADSAQGRWEGFWCVTDDRYYARCVRADGTEQWHCFGESPAKRRWARSSNVRGTSYVSVRRTSYVSVRGASYVSMRRTSIVDTQHARRTLTPAAPRTLTQVVPRTLTLDTRRTMLFGVYGRRVILVRLVRRRRARSAR